MIYTIDGDKNRTAAIVEDNGRIHFFLPVHEIPGKLLLRIEHDANAMRLNHALHPGQKFAIS